ncbi:hypothetical protein KHA96_19315 [Bacillus sp. FJAT-49711]|uniref:hypothetical protein n=1 Tax=Bacillus sp. FJAT-49711 TaxID=2833585 RepID=UPI001BC9B72E|nr:hypothetical protein [Bacillus sp. FJAT-49711]MBS4220456.1 hypothetical protein [Bacillus sp. FJAT-49711]
MKQSLYGLVLFIFLIIPPVASLMESVMIIHMHMQMPLLIIAGFLMGRFFQLQFPRFFEKWNQNGMPGILLFTIIWVYWMIPRTMDDALTIQTVEIFKFVSLPFLAGVPLRDSWKKLDSKWKNVIFISFTIMFIGMGWLYIFAPVQLCNNYLLIQQITLGWGFMTMAICMVIYLFYITFTDSSKYE